MLLHLGCCIAVGGGGAVAIRYAWGSVRHDGGIFSVGACRYRAAAGGSCSEVTVLVDEGEGDGYEGSGSDEECCRARGRGAKRERTQRKM